MHRWDSSTNILPYIPQAWNYNFVYKKCILNIWTTVSKHCSIFRDEAHVSLPVDCSPRALCFAVIFLKFFWSSQHKIMSHAKKKIESHRENFLQQASYVFHRESQRQMNEMTRTRNIPQLPLTPVTTPHGSPVSLANFPVNGVEAFRNPAFYGREQLLQDMHKFLSDHATRLFTGPACFVLHGIGGMGKTSTALEYTYVYQDEYDAIFWLRAQSPVQLAESYCAIARKLRLSVPHENQTFIIDEVKNWLEGTSE